MIIVSQDKKIITNFENILGIQIDEHIFNSDGEKDYEVETITEKRTCNMGVYETEERAKEVLQEIIDSYTSWENFKASQSVGICNSKYEMPEE